MKMLGEDCINRGFCWCIVTGIYCANLEGEGVAVRGCGTVFCRGVGRRMSRCRDYGVNEQLLAPSPLPRHGGGGNGEGADAPAATLGAYLCAVRIWIFRPRKI